MKYTKPTLKERGVFTGLRELKMECDEASDPNDTDFASKA